MKLYIWNLVQLLEKKDANFRQRVVLQLDGASWHTCPEMKEFLKLLDLKIIYSGPRQYDGAVAEKLFAYIKNGDLNPERRTMGKKR